MNTSRWLILGACAVLSVISIDEGIAQAPRSVSRTIINVAPADHFSVPFPTQTAVVLSADGRVLVFNAGDTRQRLYRRVLDEAEATPISWHRWRVEPVPFAGWHNGRLLCKRRAQESPAGWRNRYHNLQGQRQSRGKLGNRQHYRVRSESWTTLAGARLRRHAITVDFTRHLARDEKRPPSPTSPS